MKKLLIALTVALSVGTASAVPVMNAPRTNYNPYQHHHTYDDGKRDAYNNVARTAVIVGAAVIATVIIYQLGRESRWTTNERGVAYRF